MSTKKHKINTLSRILIVVDILAVVVLFILYGPFHGFRNWYIQTAMNSGHHRYLAYIFYNEKQIEETLNQNTIQESGETTDSSAIHFEQHQGNVYASEYERAVLEKDPGNDDYKVIEFEENDVHGWIVAVYDPSRLDLAMSEGGYGETISQISARTGAEVCINGGRFHLNEDDSISPDSNIIVDGEIVYDAGVTNAMITMNQDNVLVLTNATAEQLVAMHTRWALSFSPFLIVNGQKAEVTGDGGGGIRPRTAIGQRRDGIVLLLVVDGGGKGGATFGDLVDIMDRYGAYNAANLDGGGSSALSIRGETVNEPFGWGYTGERFDLNYIIWK